MRKTSLMVLLVLVLAVVLALFLVNIYWAVVIAIGKVVFSILIILLLVAAAVILRGLGKIREKLPKQD